MHIISASVMRKCITLARTKCIRLLPQTEGVRVLVFFARQLGFVILWILVLALFMCVSLCEKHKRQKMCFSYRLPFSPAVLRLERFGRSAHESLISSMPVCCWAYFILSCGRSHCLWVPVCVCVCVRHWWNCISSSNPHLLFFSLFLMLSHFLWASDKPTKQGENRALYWDACQDSPWIYGQQTAFITQPREAE